ncbi:MAG: sulfite exporter TauE/SafE family protein [Bdellovibrionales bacterium]|nr:sulfite exporter TauE/SafE family protein [Bdellovibrionales bacterium]
MLNILSALLVGLVLGLLGSGGGIITVPTLIYGSSMGIKQAVAHTMPILGLITLVQSVVEWRAGHIRLKGTLPFLVASIIGTFSGARISVLWVPEKYLILILVAVVLVAAALMAHRALSPPHRAQALLPSDSKWITPLLCLIGLSIGLLSGLVGIGGGFAMVPALSLIAGFPMNVAVGTNVAVIAIKNLFGGLGYVGEVAWHADTILLFVVCGIGGSFTGAHVRRSLSEKTLKLIFAGFLVVVSGYLIWDNWLS